MKNFTKFSALALIIIGSANTSSAQLNSASSSYDGSRGISYTNANAVVKPSASPVTAASSDMANEKTMALLKYVRSEQFVFDNLASLKKNYTISDIYYDLDKAVIRTDAEEILDNLVNLMVEQPELSVAVTAHSDSRMSVYNEGLAVRRAQAAKDYLLKKGISENRIVMEKHGRPAVKNPCDTNPGCSIAEQQLNRKTEFNIILNGKNLAHISAYGE